MYMYMHECVNVCERECVCVRVCGVYVHVHVRVQMHIRSVYSVCISCIYTLYR
jgi:hypothetical protein